jgi:hypothetical protein
VDRLNVQVASRGSRPLELVRSCGERLSIGRAYGNDVILADPYVAPQQLLFERGEDGWRVRVLDRTNEVCLNGRALAENVEPLRSGDRLTVGRSELVVYADDHPVEATRRLLLAPGNGRWRAGPAVAFAALALVCTFDVVTEFYATSSDLEWRRYAYAGLFYAALLTIWAGLWAVAGRLLRHQPHFSAQLLATVAVSFGLSLVYPAADYLDFLTGSALVGQCAYYVIGLGDLTLLLRANLLLATNLRHAGLAALCVAGMAVGLVFAAQRFAQEDFDPEPTYSSVVKPPFAHVTRDLSVDEFLARVRSKTL